LLESYVFVNVLAVVQAVVDPSGIKWGKKSGPSVLSCSHCLPSWLLAFSHIEVFTLQP